MVVKKAIAPGVLSVFKAATKSDADDVKMGGAAQLKLFNIANTQVNRCKTKAEKIALLRSMIDKLAPLYVDEQPLRAHYMRTKSGQKVGPPPTSTRFASYGDFFAYGANLDKLQQKWAKLSGKQYVSVIAWRSAADEEAANAIPDLGGGS